MKNLYKKLSEETVLQTDRITIKHDRFLLREGDERDYFYAEFGGGVMVVPIMTDGKMVFVKQYRYLRERSGIEFPGGLVDKGEAPQVSAVRELLEETGMASEEIINIGCISDSKSFIKGQIHVFIAKDAEVVSKQKLDETEEIEVVYRREDEIKDMIQRGEIWDSHTLAAWALVLTGFREGA